MKLVRMPLRIVLEGPIAVMLRTRRFLRGRYGISLKTLTTTAPMEQENKHCVRERDNILRWAATTRQRSPSEDLMSCDALLVGEMHHKCLIGKWGA
jgi:hypothetical protein